MLCTLQVLSSYSFSSSALAQLDSDGHDQEHDREWQPEELQQQQQQLEQLGTATGCSAQNGSLVPLQKAPT